MRYIKLINFTKLFALLGGASTLILKLCFWNLTPAQYAQFNVDASNMGGVVGAYVSIIVAAAVMSFGLTMFLAALSRS